jgi:hypothetical protein
MGRMKTKPLDARWRRETAFHLSRLSAALHARATWDHANTVLWQRGTDLLTTAGRALQEGRELPPEWHVQFDQLMNQLRAQLPDDLD